MAFALSVLSDEKRCEIMRLLAPHGPESLSVREIAERIAVDQRTALKHLSILRRAELVSESRVGRSRHYRADRDATRDCLAFVRALTRQLCAD